MRIRFSYCGLLGVVSGLRLKGQQLVPWLELAPCESYSYASSQALGAAANEDQ